MSRVYADVLVVTAQTGDGLVGTGEINTRELRCKVGDRVDAVVRGVAVWVDATTCRPVA